MKYEDEQRTQPLEGRGKHAARPDRRAVDPQATREMPPAASAGAQATCEMPPAASAGAQATCEMSPAPSSFSAEPRASQGARQLRGASGPSSDDAPSRNRGKIVAGVVAMVVVVIAVALVAVFMPKTDASEQGATAGDVLEAVDPNAPVPAGMPDSKAGAAGDAVSEGKTTAVEGNNGDTEVDASELFGDEGSAGGGESGGAGGDAGGSGEDTGSGTGGPTEEDEEGEWTKYY